MRTLTIFIFQINNNNPSYWTVIIKIKLEFEIVLFGN